jgi:hypothetical protein
MNEGGGEGRGVRALVGVVVVKRARGSDGGGGGAQRDTDPTQEYA